MMNELMRGRYAGRNIGCKQRLPRRSLYLAVSATAVASATAVSLAEDRGVSYAIDWYSVDGGGSTVVGAQYELTGTIGQPDAGAIHGVDLAIEGGYWGFPYAVAGCNAADLAQPYGTLDFDDVLTFLVGFGAMDPVADLAPPIGTFDFDDILAFLTSFGAGCP